MFFTILTLLLAQALSEEKCPLEHYSDEDLQKALETKCHLVKIYKEHQSTHLHSHIRTPSEETARTKIFEQEIRKILQLRADPEVTWDVGLTRFADYTQEERDAMKSHTQNVSLLVSRTARSSGMPYMTVPSKFDGWRESNWVAPVRDQVKKSSFAHAAVTPLESQLAFYKKSFKRLSVEELYHCAETNKEGTRTYEEAWNYIYFSGRLGSAYDLPETDAQTDFFGREQHKCSGFDTMTNYLEGYKIKRYISIDSEYRATQAINCVAPVVFQMDAKHNELESYKPSKNVLFKLRDSKCKRDDHSMAMVGYDSQKFIVKNSWGEDWGIKGYLYLDRSGPECQIFDSAQTVMLLRNDENDLNECRWS